MRFWLLLLLPLVLLIGWLAIVTRPAAFRKRRAVSGARAFAAWIVYDFELDLGGDWLVHSDPPTITRLLCRIFGRDVVGTVQVIAISPHFKSQRSPTDGDIAFLAKEFPGLRGLNIEGKEFTNECCIYLRAMKSLEKLWIRDTSITGRGLVELGAMDKLRVLSIAGISESTFGVEDLQQTMMNCDITIERNGSMRSELVDE